MQAASWEMYSAIPAVPTAIPVHSELHLQRHQEVQVAAVVAVAVAAVATLLPEGSDHTIAYSIQVYSDVQTPYAFLLP